MGSVAPVSSIFFWGGWLPFILSKTITVLLLTTLDAVAVEGLVRAKLAQLYPARGGAPPRQLLERLLTRAQGNPFYTEELLNYLHDHGVNPYDPQALAALALPDTLHRLVLARIDQLSDYERTTLRVASVVGRLFAAAWLPGFAPELGVAARVQANLERLAYIELTPLETPEPELTYLFKHIVTQEVAYTSLPQTIRQRLHEQLADWLEQTFTTAPPLDLLAFHYDQGTNIAKRQEYLRRAGDAARAVYANEAANDYYTRLLALLRVPAERAEVLLLLGQVQFELGLIDAAQATFAQAVESAESADDRRGQAEALSRRGRAFIDLGDYAAARTVLDAALVLAAHLDDEVERLRAERYLAGVALWEGRAEETKHLLAVSLARARRLGDRAAEVSIRINLGVQALADTDLSGCAAHYEAALALAEALGDRWHMALVLANLGELAARAGRLDEARSYSRRSVDADRAIGNYVGVALTLVNLADMACTAGDQAEAVAMLREALPLSLLGGGALLPLCVLYVVARVQLLRGAPEPAGMLLRLTVQHPAGNEELRVQARDLAVTARVDLSLPTPPLEAAIAAAEHWLKTADT